MDRDTALRTHIVTGLVGAVPAALAAAAGRRPEPDIVVSRTTASFSSADLESCAQIETADPIDPHCAALWEQNRRHFFGKPVEGVAP
ncbi:MULTISPECIES: putative entry exclusion protein TrbK-alt [unclassified Xanthobacter]|uniref:putative entry exclusion protein TrbK-alt n=1 Tax=unclassified Xanthobacter TaxID=2623496 RepID=UPI001F32C845|nr:MULTISPECIES: putative entry exclusion protein TrbK-alt [unclassified Xanthobacter]